MHVILGFPTFLLTTAKYLYPMQKVSSPLFLPPASSVPLGHGVYSEISDQREFFDAAKKSSRMIVHFYRPTTWRCEVVDKHLETLCRTHYETKFVKVRIVPFRSLLTTIFRWMSHRSHMGCNKVVT